MSIAVNAPPHERRPRMTTFAEELERLNALSVKRLRLRYEEVFLEPTAVGNKAWLVKRIAWRLQEVAEGGLSERAKARAAELARDADLRLNPPRETMREATKPKPVTPPLVPAAERTKAVAIPAPAPRGDERLPPPGSFIVRKYKGRDLKVKVLASGFEYEGEVFPSLSAAAKAITGSHCNGFAFFKLDGKGDKR
jgi:hypothetical protein